jgi:MFS family permease
VFLAAGPLVGGFLTEVFSWRWIFWVNAPIVVLITLIVSAAWVDTPRKGAGPSIDYGGVLMLVAGLGMLVFAAMQADAWGWTRPLILALLAGGLVALALFVLIERRHAEPLIEVDLFRNATFSACNLMLLTAQFSKITIFVFVALYLQDALKMSPLTAGLALLVAVVGIPVLAAPSGRIADRFGARWPALGGQALATLAMLWIGFASAWDSYGWLVPGLVLWGVALPFCFLPVQREIMNAVPVEQQGQAGGIIVTVRLLGGTIGIATCSTLLAMTDDFQVVFLATAGFMLVVLLVGWLAIERLGGSRVP